MNKRERDFTRRFAAASVEDKGDRWRITGGKDSGFSVVEVVPLNMGCVLVYGDYDPCIVQRNGSAASTIQCAREDGVCGYFVQKASLGMGTGRKTVWEWSADDAVADIQHNFIDSDGAEEADAFREALEAPFETQAEMLEALGDCGVSDAWEYGWLGERPSQRVVVAWAAFRRVIRHLEESEASHG